MYSNEWQKQKRWAKRGKKQNSDLTTTTTNQKKSYWIEEQ